MDRRTDRRKGNVALTQPYRTELDGKACSKIR